MTAAELAVLVGKRLTLHRLNQEMSRAELAGSVGLSQSYISLIERGERLPHLDVLVQLAEALDVPVMMFFADEKALNEVGIDLAFLQLMKPLHTVCQKLGLKRDKLVVSARVVWALHAPPGHEGKPPV